MLLLGRLPLPRMAAALAPSPNVMRLVLQSSAGLRHERPVLCGGWACFDGQGVRGVDAFANAMEMGESTAKRRLIVIGAASVLLVTGKRLLLPMGLQAPRRLNPANRSRRQGRELCLTRFASLAGDSIGRVLSITGHQRSMLMIGSALVGAPTGRRSMHGQSLTPFRARLPARPIDAPRRPTGLKGVGTPLSKNILGPPRHSYAGCVR